MNWRDSANAANDTPKTPDASPRRPDLRFGVSPDSGKRASRYGGRMTTTDLTHLQGQSVLVKSTAERGDPKIAMRGTIDAKMDDRGFPVVKIILDFPDMNYRVAHQGVIELDTAGVERLLASEHNGAFEYTINTLIDLGPPTGAGSQVGN